MAQAWWNRRLPDRQTQRQPYQVVYFFGGEQPRKRTDEGCIGGRVQVWLNDHAGLPVRRIHDSDGSLSEYMRGAVSPSRCRNVRALEHLRS